jgi:hypothetical protein
MTPEQKARLGGVYRRLIQSNLDRARSYRVRGFDAQADEAERQAAELKQSLRKIEGTPTDDTQEPTP